MHEEWCENGGTKNIIEERRSSFFCYAVAEELGDPAEHMNSESNRHMIRSLGEFHCRQKTKRHLRGVYKRSRGFQDVVVEQVHDSPDGCKVEVEGEVFIDREMDIGEPCREDVGTHN